MYELFAIRQFIGGLKYFVVSSNIVQSLKRHIIKDLKMAQQQTIEINMARFENSPWGFRLHGGADFSSPLTIQKVRHSYLILLHITHKNDIFVWKPDYIRTITFFF